MLRQCTIEINTTFASLFCSTLTGIVPTTPAWKAGTIPTQRSRGVWCLLEYYRFNYFRRCLALQSFMRQNFVKIQKLWLQKAPHLKCFWTSVLIFANRWRQYIESGWLVGFYVIDILETLQIVIGTHKNGNSQNGANISSLMKKMHRTDKVM